MSSSTNSRLFTLPPELRLEIYAYVFAGVHMCQKRITETMLANKLIPPPGLLLTCKEIYADCIMPFYATATFHFDIALYVAHWMQSIPRKHLTAVTSITYDMRNIPPVVSVEARAIMAKQESYRLMRHASSAGVVLDESVIHVKTFPREI